MFALWTVYFIANISPDASTCGIIVSPHYPFLVQTGLGGPHFVNTVGLRFYKAATKTYVENEIYDIIGRPDRGSLMMRKILDHVKTRY